ncbi:MAG: TonB-dependent receptor plug domain-containing protein [Thermoanaerobaculia bacterium]
MKFVLSFSLFLFAFPLAAQQTSAPVQETIVVTASAQPESIEETPATVTVITREEIEARGARDVIDVLREVPGLAVSRTGSPGKSTSLFIRGGSSKQALVLWNGVEMNNPYFSGYNFGQLSTSGVERVEIVRGPFSALYGSEAVSGVVQVLTEPRNSGATVDVQLGEHGLINGSLSGAYVADRFIAHGAVERREDDGFFANDDSQSNAYSAGATFKPVTGLSLGLLARHSSYDLGIPFSPNSSFDAFVPSPLRREEGSETQIVAPLRYESNGTAYELRLSEARRDETFRDPEGSGDSDTSSTMRSARASAQFKTTLGTITGGGEWERAEVDHLDSFSFIDERDRTNKSLFVEDRMSFPLANASSIEVTAGLRYDDFDTFGGETTPRIAAAWLKNGHKIRAAYGAGFRAPAIGELYSPFFGNANLDAERSTNYEIGYERFTTNGSASVTLFHSDYDDLIAFGASTFENIDAAKATGIELGASHRFGAFDVMASYTWLDTEDEATGERLLRRPEHSGSVALGYHHGAYDAQFVVTHKGQRDDVTDIFPFGVVSNEANTTADFTFHYAMGALSPYVKIENLTDESYEEVFGYRSAPRRAMIGVRYEIK